MAKSKSLTEEEEKIVNNIKENIRKQVAEAGEEGISVRKAAEIFKGSFDEAIREVGEKGKESLIRSQEPIKIFHEVIKQELLKNGVNKLYIFPRIGQNNGELNLYGHFKDKTQDVVVIPNCRLSCNSLI